MEVDKFIEFAKQRRLENGREIMAHKKPTKTVISAASPIDIGLQPVVDLMRSDGESIVLEMRYQMQPQAAREMVEEPYVDLAKIDSTREGTVAVHDANERIAAIESAANPGSDLKEVRAVARFANGFHYEPKKDNVA